MPDRWQSLRPFEASIPADAQVMLVAATGGAKSTLVATMTLRVPSLVAVDEKGALTLPHARVVELPQYNEDEPERYGDAVRSALRWREEGERGNRVIIRPHVLDIEHFEAHNVIFRAVYERRHTLLWLDEISATGATAQRSQPWLRALSARGRTRGIGMWTCTQAPFGLTPPVLRRNATYTIVGPLDPQDIKDIPRPGIEIAETIPRKSGRFMVYVAGEREPYRLYLPIPPILKGWKAP